MQIERRYTEPGGDPYAGVEFAERTSTHRQSGRLRRLRGNAAGPGRVVAGRHRHPGAEVLPQGGRRRRARRPSPRTACPSGRRGPSRRPARRGERRDRRPPGDPPPRRLLALLGRDARLLRHRRGRARRSTTSSPTCSLHQIAAPNSPQWFNTGLNFAYGITGPAQGHFYATRTTGELEAVRRRLRAPAAARLLHPVRQPTTSSNEGGIMDLWVREARLFKYGSGTGSNFSNLRGENEKLSGGGKLVRPDELPEDRRPRRRRHQVRRHHPPRRQDGLPRPRPPRHRAVHQLEGRRGDEGRRARRRLADALRCTSTTSSRRPRGAMSRATSGSSRGPTRRSRRPSASARQAGVPDVYDPARARPRAAGRHASSHIDEYDTDWQGEAYDTVSGQNSNNSVRVTNDFMRRGRGRRRVEPERPHRARQGARRGPPATAVETLPARELWDDIAETAWLCADPGLQFDTPSTSGTPARPTAPSAPSNPCSEYMFLDDTACNLASLNLLRVLRSEPTTSTSSCYRHGVRLWTVVLEISRADGAVPVQGDRALSATTTARSASATPTSARC